MYSLNPVSGAHIYCNNTVGYSYYNTDTECTRAIASTLIHAVVLCESAQRYRALMAILQSHRKQNMIRRCYPNVSAILQTHTKSCLCSFSKILICFLIQNIVYGIFFIYLSPLFFYLHPANYMYMLLCELFSNFISSFTYLF